MIPERLNLLHWTGSDIARASTFQFFSTGFMRSWFIYLFSPFTFSYLHPSFVYSYSHLFPSFIRQLLNPFSLYSFRCFVLPLLLTHSLGFGIKNEIRRRVHLPTANKTQQYKIWAFHGGTYSGTGLDTVQAHWWVPVSLHIQGLESTVLFTRPWRLTQHFPRNFDVYR